MTANRRRNNYWVDHGMNGARSSHKSLARVVEESSAADTQLNAELLDDAVRIIIDSDDRVCSDFKNTCAILGTVQGQLGPVLFDLLHPGDVDGIRKLLAEVRGGTCTEDSVDCRIRNTEGNYRYLEGRLLAFGPDDAIIVAFDVTRHRRDASHFQQIVEGALQGTIVHRDGKFLYVNETLAHMVGVDSIEKLLAGNDGIADFIHPEDLPMVAANIQGRLEGRDDVPLNYAFRLVRRDDRQIWVDCRASVVDWDGEPAVLAALFDISEQKAAEEARLQTEELFRRIFQTSPDIITLTRRADGTYVNVNESFLRFFGFERSEVIGKTSQDLGIWTESDTRDKFIARLNEDGRLENFEAVVNMRDGSQSQINIIGAELEFGGEELLLLISRDITDQHQHREELRESKESAELANRTKSEFLANMSHELRTPLNAILGFSEAITREMFGTIKERRYVEYAQDIHTSGRHLLEIINDILDLSKVEAGKLELEIDEVSVSESFEQCLRLVNERAVYAGLLIKLEVPDEPVRILADQRRMKQVFINLLSNAIKFTREGGEIGLTCRVTEDGGCEMAVSDNGVGMDEAGIEKALTPFGQVDSSLARQEEGAGLGIPLVVAFVEMMGARLTLESVVDAGTTVTIIFPPDKTVVGD